MNERRARVLQLVAEAYIDTAHPVPSGQVAERLDVSSATVRNDFGSLESEGLLQQPHTSAGRIPTALGFHSYASRFLPPKPLSTSERRRLGLQLAGATGDQFYALASRLASELSGYAVTVRLPPDDALHILEIHLAMLSSRRLLAVVVLENGVVRQLGVDLDPVPDDEVIDDAERNLRQLTLPVGEVPRALAAIAARADEELARTLAALAAAWNSLQPPRTYSDGLARLLAEPEGSDPNFVRLVVSQVEGSATVPVTVDVTHLPESGLLLDLDDAMARVVTAFPYGGSLGSFTLVGPARMRYPVALTIAHEFRSALARPHQDHSAT
jgi:heat-inducible transcriptional repressor